LHSLGKSGEALAKIASRAHAAPKRAHGRGERTHKDGWRHGQLVRFVGDFPKKFASINIISSQRDKK
jgi:hypothetical protein